MAKKSTKQIYRKLVIKNSKKTYKDMTEKEIEELKACNTTEKEV